ncbi:MAG: glycosyltransferase [Pseudonocardiaceae bacterium]|nr:glycosyltransferase [Pseudonocardiaceae bacterium]
MVVTWRGHAHIAACLDALAAQTRPHRTLVVDNASQDGTALLLAEHPARPEVLRLARNTGYAGALAAALPRVDTRFVAWLNDDTEPEPDWLARLEDALLTDQAAAAAGSRLTHQDGTAQSVGVRLTGDGHGADLTGKPREPFGFCGGAALLRNDVLAEIGGVAGDFFCYYEDTELSWRLRLAGWRVLAVHATVRHLHGASAELGSASFHRWNERNRLLMLLRCAPARVALGQLARFAAITALLPVRRAPAAPNFTVRLRLRVLAEVALRLPGTLRARARVSRHAVLRRTDVWRTWAGS